MKLRHKDKVKLAKKMLSNAEKKARIPKFLSSAWIKRSKAIRTKINAKRV